ncbi:MAG: peptidylprolyl isomerase [Verrucomicrobiales bacterium]
MKKLPTIVILIAAAGTALTFVFAAPDNKTDTAKPGSIATAPAARAARAADSNVIARVGDSDVTLDEVRAALTKLSDNEQAALAKDPALLNQVVRMLLVQRLMLNQAKAKNWEERPEVVAAVERAREAAIAESYLQSISTPPADYPSEAELQQAYEIAKPKLSSPKQWRLAQIYIALLEGSTKEDADKAQAKLDGVKKQLAVKGADFGAIAKSHSDESVSAAANGEIGWLTEPQIQPEIRTDVAILTAGGTSPALRMKDGWHIVKCLEVREPTTIALEDVRGALTEQMRKEKTRANSQAWMAKLVQENPLAINEIALAKMLEDAVK